MGLYDDLRGHDPAQEEALRVADGLPADPGAVLEEKPEPAPKKTSK